MSDKVLVIGSGAREHALAWKLAQSAHVKQVLVAPGNAGTADSGKISNSAVSISNAPILTQFCKDHNIGLTVVNPITLLTAGIIDDLTAAGVRCFGPTAKAAQLEASKSFAKGFMDRHGIPTARWKSFTNPHEACSFITYAEFPALVVKTSGLTSGRDIYIANDKDEACRAVQQLTQDRTLGAPMETLIVEEHLEGEELSCLGITDGTTLAAMPLVQLLKHQTDGDQGSQTQAIGAFCPAAQISETLSKEIKATILQKAIDAMRQEGWQYAGVFGARVMLTGQGPKVLGFKCSFQEPESQVILPLLKNDLYEVTGAAVDGRLCRCLPVCLQDRFAVTVVMSCVGYSDGQEIKGLSIAKGLGLEVFHAGTAMKDGKVVTNGGRVLTVTAVKKDLVSALEEANKGVSAIEFPGAVYRQDEGYQPVAILEQARGDRDSAVPAPAMYGAQPDAARSGNADVCEKLRECAGHFALNTAQYKDPILVCTTNSVGAKIKVAHACNTHRAVGQDLVAVCLNDTWARGAEPLFFMPHLAGGLVDVEVSTAITDGLAAACRKAGCTLLEREIAEMPDVYPKGTYSLSGCTVGVAQKENLLPRPDKMTEGDLVIGISSSGGVHCSSIELISNIMEKYTLQYSSLLPTGHGDQTWGELLLKPPALFSNTLVPALQSGHIRACAPVTGGGLPGSILRVLPESLGIIIDALCWKMPGIFSWLYKEGGLSEQEMAQKFNCGIGAVLIVQKNKAPQILREVQKQEEAWLIGAIVPRRTGSLHVRVRHLSEALKVNTLPLLKNIAANQTPTNIMKVAVFISSTGTKLKPLIDLTKQPGSWARLSLIISNKAGGEELQKAAGAGIPTRVIDHTLCGCHSEFESTISKVLEEFSIELICLAGFVRTMSEGFLNTWKGKILNIYPSLSPSFKVENTPHHVLQAGMRVTGCTVRFMLDGATTGPIILQETVAVELDDTESSLGERMEEAQQRAVAKAVHLVASGSVHLGEHGNVCWKCKDGHPKPVQ